MLCQCNIYKTIFLLQKRVDAIVDRLSRFDAVYIGSLKISAILEEAVELRDKLVRSQAEIDNIQRLINEIEVLNLTVLSCIV